MGSVVEVRGVRKVYLFNVANVDFDVESGGIHVVLGPNGSGKSSPHLFMWSDYRVEDSLSTSSQSGLRIS